MACENAELSLLLTADPEIRELNRKWLNRDRPTDVLAFPQMEYHPGNKASLSPQQLLGDVVISLETADRQAKEFGHSLDHELNRLLAHGILHLLGFDHTQNQKAARQMRERENQLLARIEKEEKNSLACKRR